MQAPSDALVRAAIEALPADALLAYLVRQRWFAAKSAAPSAARITSAIVAPWGGGAFALTRISIDTREGVQVYQLPLAAARDVPSRSADRIIAEVTLGGAPVSLSDAAHDVTFRAGLARALAQGAVADTAAGQRWAAEPANRDRVRGVADMPSSVGTAEQSNTCVIFGNAAIYKLFRLLKPGLHPDVEVTSFLTERARFPHTPALLATTWFDDGDERTISGMLQEYFPGSVDAWSDTLERASGYFAAPVDREAENSSVADARRLGEITRDMHEALACDDRDPAFAPEPATPEHVHGWARRTQLAVRDSWALLDRQSRSASFPAERRPEAKALVGRAEHYAGWIDEIVDTVASDLGARIRIHGDYHLGQVLRTASRDFKVIDFEGEPSRALAERREKNSPLRDVAGMLRSFSYAAATLATSVERQVDPRTREIRSARWERDVRDAFLQGYLRPGRSSAEARILPANEQHVRQLIALFETDKAFYELAYELNNRPAWVWIPMRGIAKLFTR
jgi:maltose alpha-D-glucosyltransferase/alpha-amylase